MDDFILRLVPASLWLAFLWIVESFAATHGRRRFRHGLVNLSLAGMNGCVLFTTLGAASVWACKVSPIKPSADFAIAHAVACFVVLDLFSYAWHRLNHSIPLLWRLHAVHHSDSQMDVTTAGRFHLAEIGVGAFLRIPVLFISGVSPFILLAYETTLVLVSMLHHAAFSLGAFDRVLRVLTASPLMHSIHHSRDPVDFGSNFSSVFSIWDRLFGTFRLTSRPISHGLDEIQCDSIASLVSLPFRKIDEGDK